MNQKTNDANGSAASPVLAYAANRPTDGGNKWSWAAYLGASWTWCIGMFLPVLLIRDYGPWAWVIFAVPNVVGAAAMGWVMRSASMSRAYRVNHGPACRLFSLVTIAFQFYFYFWMIPKLVLGYSYGFVGLMFGVFALVQSAFTPIFRGTWIRLSGFVVLAISAAIAVALSQRHVLVWPEPQSMTLVGTVGLSLVCLAGFVACPYLDLTFHRARIETSDADAKFAFGVGFGVFFALMIVFTFFYATNMFGLGGIAGVLLAVHLFAQMCYTVNLHGVELKNQAFARDEARTLATQLGVTFALTLVAGGIVWNVGPETTFHGRTLGELGYRIFMSFYGLLFPAYVLLAIRRSRVSVVAWLTISAVATPFYWMAFIEGRMSWAIGGVAVIVIGALIGRRLVPSPVTPGEG